MTDVTQTLQGKDVDVYLRWEQMTTIGPYYSGKVKIGTFKMPAEYQNHHRKRTHRPGPAKRIENY